MRVEQLDQLGEVGKRPGSSIPTSGAIATSGETVYRLHVVGLSRDEAAALCSLVKGDGGSCSVVR